MRPYVYICCVEEGGDDADLRLDCLKLLKRYLAPAARPPEFDLWDITAVEASDDALAAVATAIARATHAILIVTPALTDNLETWTGQVQPLAAKAGQGLPLYWIAARPAPVEATFLNAITPVQAALGPLSLIPAAQREAAWLAIAQEISRGILQTLADRPNGEINPPPQALASPPAKRRSFAVDSYDLAAFLDRDEQTLEIDRTVLSRACAAGRNIFIAPYIRSDEQDLVLKRTALENGASSWEIHWDYTPDSPPPPGADLTQAQKNYVSKIMAIAGIMPDVPSQAALQAVLEPGTPVYYTILPSSPASAFEKDLLAECIRWWSQLLPTPEVYPLIFFFVPRQAGSTPARNPDPAARWAWLKANSDWYAGCLDQFGATGWPVLLDPMRPIARSHLDSWLLKVEDELKFSIAKVRQDVKGFIAERQTRPMQDVRNEFEAAWMDKITRRGS